MTASGQQEEGATLEEVSQAIEGLSREDLLRLVAAARSFMWGSDYIDSYELINEAVARTMNAADGGSGRRWPTHVPFIAYMIKTMQGLANDSKGSLNHRKTTYLESITPEGASAEQVLGALGHHQADVLTQTIEVEETEEEAYQATSVLSAIEDHFSGDEDVSWIIQGLKDEMSAGEIRTLSGMDQTQYETARRRFRRGLGKLFPDKRLT